MNKAEAATQSLKQQSAWLLGAKVIGFGFSFVLPLLIVRYLTQDEVGHYREAFQVIMNAIVILPLGFSMSSFYFLARETADRRGAAILNILLFNFVVGGIACVTLFLYPQLIGNIFKSAELTQLGPLIGVVIWIWVFSTFLETVAIANQEAKVATVFIVLAQFSKTLLMGSAVFLFATVESFIYAAMIQGLIQSCILFWYLKSRFPRFWTKFELGFFKDQMVYAIPFGVAGILWMLQNDIHNYFVGYKFTSAEYAIYAYGCFEVPLIAMLAESVTAVLIPRMNTLQVVGDKEEMIRLTARAMQKLAFFYFPIYAFLLITAQTFIITLFTTNYQQSASIFVINITILPFSILITDPIVRSYKELGRLFLVTRVAVLLTLVTVLYYGLEHFGLTGMITAAVGAIILEKIIAETMVIRKLGLGMHHLPLMTDVLKTAVICVAAGIVTYFVYENIKVVVETTGEHLAREIFSTQKLAILNFVGGSLVLFISAAVFAPIYLFLASLWGVIEEDEKQSVRALIGRFLSRRRVEPISHGDA